MASTWNLSKGLAAVVTSAAAFGLCPSAAADPATLQPNPAEQLPGLPALTQLSPIIQQAASDPQQATQLLMAAASAFTQSQATPSESKSVASSVTQFVQEPTNLPDAAPIPHVPPVGAQPGAQAHLPTGINPTQAAGPVPVASATAAPPGFGADAPPTQDFMYPSIGSNCLADGSSALATALSVAGPAAIPAPGPRPGQTAYVFTAVGTPGPAAVQKLPLNVTWVNLTTGKSGSATLKPRSDINPDGPTTLTVIADTGSGSIMSTIFGQVTTKERQCQFMPTIGSTVVP